MFNELAKKRRSVRKFSEKTVEQDKIDRLVEAALCAPSSAGHRPWEFIVVRDPDLLRRLSEAKDYGSTFLKNAPLGIVVCAAPEKSDVWIEDASIASTFILLAAASLGLGACWIQLRKRVRKDGTPSQDFVSDLLNIPDHLKLQSIIAVGYPAEEKSPRKPSAQNHPQVHRDFFGKPYTT